jgi:hypothetical protein
MTEMTDQIASVDAGNGGTNAVLARTNGNHKTFYEPSVRAAASGDTLGLGKEWEMGYDYVDWNGSTATATNSINFWWRWRWRKWASRMVKLI